MYEIFKTVLILSTFGFAITALLLCLKPFTAKILPARWQYIVWIAVLVAMVAPVYKFIPQREAQKLSPVLQSGDVRRDVQTGTAPTQNNTEITAAADMPVEYKSIDFSPGFHIRLPDLIAYVWIFGAAVFLLAVFSSYALYNQRKRKRAVLIEDNGTIEYVKRKLNIKRNIKLKMSPDVRSPLLVGILFPVIYIPCREIDDGKMYMILMHELTHYKRKDLLVKWFALIVNAVHWFNPLAYLLCANLSEACEVSCDMAVTKNMTDEEQKLYMKTILELAEGEKNNV